MADVSFSGRIQVSAACSVDAHVRQQNAETRQANLGEAVARSVAMDSNMKTSASIGLSLRVCITFWCIVVTGWLSVGDCRQGQRG